MPSIEKEQDREALAQLAVLRKGLMCDICNNFLRDACNLPCGHNFCLDCADDALADKSMCPSCKNPAWQKDTVKNAQADSAVHDWVKLCEPKYQALVAAAAAADDSDETSSMRSEQWIEDDEEEDAKNRLSCMAPPSSADAASPSADNGCRKATADAETETHCPSPQASGKTSRTECEAEHRTASSTQVLSTREVVGGAAVASDTSAGTCAERGTMEHHLSLEQEKENASPPSACKNLCRGPATDARDAESTPSSERNSSCVRFHSSPSADGGCQSRTDVRTAVTESVSRGKLESPDPLEQYCKSPARDDTSRETGGVSVEQGSDGGEAPLPQAPRLRQMSSKEIDANSWPVLPVVKAPARQGLPPSQVPQRECTEATLPPLPADDHGEAGKETLPFGFSGSVPETCDVLGLDSRLPSPAKAGGFIPSPTLKVAREVWRGESAKLDNVLMGTPERAPPSFDEVGKGQRSEESGADARGKKEAKCVPVRGGDESWVCFVQQSMPQCRGYGRHEGSSREADSKGTRSTLEERQKVVEDDVRHGAVSRAAVDRDRQSDGDGYGVGDQSDSGDDIESAVGSGTDLDEAPPTAEERRAHSATSPVRSDGGRTESVINTHGDRDGENGHVLGALSPLLCTGIGCARETAQRDSLSELRTAAESCGRKRRAAAGPTTPENTEADHETEEETCETPETPRGSLVGSASDAFAPESVLVGEEVNITDPFPLPPDLPGRNPRLTGTLNIASEKHETSNVYDRFERSAIVINERSPRPHCEFVCSMADVVDSPPATESMILELYTPEDPRYPASVTRSKGERISRPKDEGIAPHADGPVRESITRHGGDGRTPDNKPSPPAEGSTGCLSTETSGATPAVNQRRSDKSTCSAAIREGADDAAPLTQSLDEKGGRANVFETRTHGGTQEISGDHEAESEQKEKANRVLHVPETLPSQSLSLTPLTFHQESKEGAVDRTVGTDGGDEGARHTRQTALEMDGSPLLDKDTHEADEQLKVPETVAPGNVDDVDNGLDGNEGSIVLQGVINRPLKEPSRPAESGSGVGLPTANQVCNRTDSASVVSPAGRQDDNDIEDANANPLENAAPMSPTLCTRSERYPTADEESMPVERRRQENDSRGGSLPLVPEAAPLESLGSQDVPETADAAWEGDAVAARTIDDCDTADRMLKRSSSSINGLQHSEVPETLRLLRRETAETPTTIDETGGVGCAEDARDEDGAAAPQTSSLASGNKRSTDSSKDCAGESSGNIDGGSSRRQFKAMLQTPQDHADYTSDSSAPPAFDGTAVGTPLILRGGSGSVKSDDGCECAVSPAVDPSALDLDEEVVDTYHDSWGAGDAGGYGNDSDPHNAFDSYRGDEDVTSDDDNDNRALTPATTRQPTGQSGARPKPVRNMYETASHLEIRPDEDDTPWPSSTEPRRMSTQTVSKKAGPSRFSVSKKTPRLSSSATVGIGSPSPGKWLAPGPSALGNGAIEMRRKEEEYRARSNSILAAGRCRGGVSGGHSSLVAQGIEKDICSIASYEETPGLVGPDTQDIEALESELAAKDARRQSDCFRAYDPSCSESTRRRAINLANVDIGNENKCGGRQRASDSMPRYSAGKKRSRDATSTKYDRGSIAGQRSNAPNKNSHNALPVVLVLLGCEEREVKRAKLLCRKLGQVCLHTQLVRGATHVVVGSAHVADVTIDKDVSRDKGVVSRQLVTHELEGYREAVMLGLWVLDFSWVEACVKPPGEPETVDTKERGGGSGRKRHRTNPFGLVRLVPARDYEIAGCFDDHQGCNPRIGRMCRVAARKHSDRATGADGLFAGLEFHVVDVAGQSRSGSESISARDEENVKFTRLLQLGGGIVFNGSSSTRNVAGRRTKSKQESYSDKPLAQEDDDSDTDQNDESSADEADGGVVMIVTANKAVGEISPGLARAVIDRANGLSSVAAVTHKWAVRSIEEGSRLDFEPYSLRTNSRGSSPETDSALRASPTSTLPRILAPDGTAAAADRFQMTEGQPSRRNGVNRGGSGRGRGSGRLDSNNRRLIGGSGRGVGGSREVVIVTGAQPGCHHFSPELEQPAMTNEAVGREAAKHQFSEQLSREAQKAIKSASKDGREERSIEMPKKSSGSKNEFEFTRVSEQPVANDVPCEKPSFWSSNYAKDLMDNAGIGEEPEDKNALSYNEINKIERKLFRALEDSGYLELPHEQKLGEFWFEIVHDGIIGARGQKFEHVAIERGCPLTIIRRVFEDNGLAHMKTAKMRLEALAQGEKFLLWEEHGAVDSNSGRRGGRMEGGSSVDDALEVF